MASIQSCARRIGRAVTAAALVFCPAISHADEGGISFWLPGQYGSLAATPQTPGWALGAIYYHTNVTGGGNVAASREIEVGRFSPTVNVNLNLSLNAQGDLMVLAPSYTFATPVFGGQFAVSMAGIFGRDAASIAGTLTAAAGPLVTTRMGELDSSLTSVGDLYPTATLPGTRASTTS
jgi:hypothetical protein